MEVFLIMFALILVAGVIAKGRYKPAHPQEPAASGAGVDPANILEEELKRKIPEYMEQDRFFLMIQPVVELETGRIWSGEITCRLSDPEHGVIYPNVFLPVVNRMGLQESFDLHIFEKTCAWLSGLSRERIPLDSVSVNFSRKTLSRPDLTETLSAIARRYNVPHSQLALEITEWEKETDIAAFRQNLTQLRNAGFQVFLDDLGSGVASPIDLYQYCMDVVKIDRSVLLAAQTQEGKAGFRALVNLSEKQGFSVVCEGIETGEQAALARSCGCRYGQGFFWYRPVEAEVFLESRKAK